MVRSFAKELAAALAAAAVIFTAAHARPAPEPDAPVVERLMHVSELDSLAPRFPWVTASAEEAMRSPRFEQDRRAFVEDLLRTGQMKAERAEKLATYAVRESYVRKVPPALVFGVLMVENPDFRSTARSSVGAVGLMQIHPGPWVGTLGRLFGRNLRDDETNIRYGVYILGHLVHSGSDWMDPDSTVRRGLLRYNGCVRGSNTRDCFRYPDKVRDRVERLALSQCGEGGYRSCVSDALRVSREDAELTW